MIGEMSFGDVRHVVNSLTRQGRPGLSDGNRRLYRAVYPLTAGLAFSPDCRVLKSYRIRADRSQSSRKCHRVRFRTPDGSRLASPQFESSNLISVLAGDGFPASGQWRGMRHRLHVRGPRSRPLAWLVRILGMKRPNPLVAARSRTYGVLYAAIGQGGSGILAGPPCAP